MRLALLALLLAACAADPVLPPRDCTPGTTSACVCLGATTGVQTCTASGTVGACLCPDAGGSSDVVKVADAAAATDVIQLDGGAIEDRTVAMDTSCGTGRVRCGAACVDTLTDGTNCGTCGRACGTATICVSGTCLAGDAGAMDAGTGADVPPAAMDSTSFRDVCRFICETGCADTETDPRNCGRCGNDCTALPGVVPSRVTCEGGQCSVFRACLAGRLNCTGNGSTGCETSVNTSFRCGSCTRGCVEPTSICVISSDSPTGYACGTNCAPPFNARCGGTCVNTDSDDRNCGRCRVACAAGQTCRMGTCQ